MREKTRATTGYRLYSKRFSAIIRKSFRDRTRRHFAMVLPGIVVFTTTYSLILPALTLERDNVQNMNGFSLGSDPVAAELLNCSETFHHHSQDCYSEVNGQEILVCGQADYVIHTHDEGCFNANGDLICTLEEIEGEPHVHKQECYEKGPNDENPAEMGWVTADEEGNVISGEPEHLICGQLEVREHQHDENCFVQEDSWTDNIVQADLNEETMRPFLKEPEPLRIRTAILIIQRIWKAMELPTEIRGISCLLICNMTAGIIRYM